MAKKKRAGKTKSLSDSGDSRDQEEIEQMQSAPPAQQSEEPSLLERLRAKSGGGESTKRITTDLPLSRFRRWKRAVVDLETDGNTLVNEIIEDFLKRAGYPPG